MQARAEEPALATRDVRVEEFGGPVGADPTARWLRVPPKTNLKTTRQDERRPGGFFARYRMASLSELLIQPSNSA